MAFSKLELRITALEETFERRIAKLEAEVAILKQQQNGENRTSKDWLEKIYGTFANDPDYDAAMELGRKYREAQRPKPLKKKRPRNHKPSKE